MKPQKSLPLQQELPASRRAFLAVACGLCVTACGSGSLPNDGGVESNVPDDTSLPDIADSNTLVDASRFDANADGSTDSSLDTFITCTGQDAGAIADYPIGIAKDVALPNSEELGLPPGTVVIVRDERGIYALSGLCKHFGGRLAVQNGRIRCTNSPSFEHTAEYDREGINTVSERNGPPNPRYDLQNYKVSLCNGRIFVDRTEEVARGTRSLPT